MGRRTLAPRDLFDAACNGDRAALARALSVLERGDEAAREMAFYLTGDEEPGESFTTRLQGAGRITPSQMSAVQKEIEILLIAQARAVVTPYVDHDGSSLKSCSNYSSQPTAYGGG